MRMLPTEVFYKSDNGKYRVLYCRDDLGKKYKVQKLDEYGHWKFMEACDNPLTALTIMKRAAKEW